MGHITNATSFRLTSTVKHKFIFANSLDKRYLEYLQKNFMLLKFLEVFFQYYSYTATPDNIRKLTKENVDENFLKKVITNPIVATGFIYSHSNIARGPTLRISVYLFDSELEKWRAKKSHLEKLTPRSMFHPRKFIKRRVRVIYDLARLSKLRFTQKGKKKRFKVRNRWFKFRIWKKKKFHVLRNRLRWLHLLPWIARNVKKKKKIKKRRYKWRYVWRTITGKKLRPRRKHFEFSNKRHYTLWRRFRTRLPKPLFMKRRRRIELSKKEKKYVYQRTNFIKLLRFFPLIHRTKFIRKLPAVQIKNRITFAKIMLRLFSQTIQNAKAQIFITVILRAALLSVVTLPKFRPTFMLFKTIMSLRLIEYQNTRINFYFFRSIFHKRFIFFYNAYNYIRASISTIENNRHLSLSISSLQLRNVTAHHILNYIKIKLGQFFKINDIQSPILRELKKARLKGFRIIISGRLTRKERASFMIKGRGAVPKAKKKAFIDYAADYKVMRFGLVGIKIWLHSKTIKPVWYTFKFKS